MTIDERGERSEILFLQLSELLWVSQNLLDKQCIDVLSRDFAGTEKTDVVDHVSSKQSKQMVFKQGNAASVRGSKCSTGVKAKQARPLHPLPPPARP